MATNTEFYHAAAVNNAHEAIQELLQTRAQEQSEYARRFAQLNPEDGTQAN